MRLSVLAGSLALVMLGTQAGWETAAQEAIPDAPKPQQTLPDLRSVAPGEGSASPADDSKPDATAGQQPAAAPTATPAPTANAQANPASASGGSNDAAAVQGEEAIHTLYLHVVAVDVGFTVKDSKGHLVPGL